jgi:hypothetical protein
MKPIEASEIRSNADYALARDEMRSRVLAIKKARRVHLGDHLTILFENHDTMLYQVQEMMRVEGIEDPKAIAHEIKTYNELVPGRDELKATLLVEYAEPAERDAALRALVGLQDSVALEVEGAGRVMALFDDRQISDGRISSVHYLTFALGSEVAAGLRGGAGATLHVCHPELTVSTALDYAQLAAVRGDLA